MIRRKPRLSPAEIIARYEAGESTGLLSLRARVPDYHITAVLVSAGVRLRGPSEAIRLAMRGAQQFASTKRMHKRLGRFSAAIEA